MKIRALNPTLKNLWVTAFLIVAGIGCTRPQSGATVSNTSRKQPELRDQGYRNRFWISSNVSPSGYCAFRLFEGRQPMLYVGVLKGAKLEAVKRIGECDDSGVDVIVERGGSLNILHGNRIGVNCDIFELDLEDVRVTELNSDVPMTNAQLSKILDKCQAPETGEFLVINSQPIQYRVNKDSSTLNLSQPGVGKGQSIQIPGKFLRLWASQDACLIFAATSPDLEERYFTLKVEELKTGKKPEMLPIQLQLP